jgi:hypothetical protein
MAIPPNWYCYIVFLGISLHCSTKPNLWSLTHPIIDIHVIWFHFHYRYHSLNQTSPRKSKWKRYVAIKLQNLISTYVLHGSRSRAVKWKLRACLGGLRLHQTNSGAATPPSVCLVYFLSFFDQQTIGKLGWYSHQSNQYNLLPIHDLWQSNLCLQI